MLIDVLKVRVSNILARANSSDGIILTIGVLALVCGVLVDVFVVRLVCLLVVLGAAVLVYAALRAKQAENASASDGSNPRSHSQPQSGMMRKLIFDDFDSFSGGKILSEEPAAPDRSFKDTPTSVEMAASFPSFSQVVPSLDPIKHESVQPPPRDFVVADFFDVDSPIYQGESEPRTEFDFLLNKVLTLIKDVLFAHSVAFFWANREKQQFVMEARVSDSPLFMSARRFPMGHDLLSNIALTGKPELITDVNPLSEPELLRYYERPAAIKSFVGVPVFFSKMQADASGLEHPVAVIAIDSQVEDQFGEETVALLGQYTKLVSAIIKSYTEKYDLLLDAELLKSIRRLQERIRNDFAMSTILHGLAEESAKLINWDFLSIVLHDESKHAWVAKKVTSRAHEQYVVTEQAIDFPDSIVGETIRRNAHRTVDDLDHVKLPRYFSGEQLGSKGSFVSVPMSSLNKCYGALNIESKEKLNFSRQDIEILYRLAENASAALEIFYMQQVINEYVIVDGVTGTYSKKFFTQKMEEELHRSDDSGSDLSMLFITLDRTVDVVSRFGQDGFERVMLTLAKAVRASVRPYDIVGRYDENRFGVLLVNTAANEAYLWAEKIRKNVASHVISLDGKNFSITISTGVCGALEGMRKEELVGNAVAVLNKAAEAGGNAVRVF